MIRSSTYASRRRKSRGLEVTVCGRVVCPNLKARIESSARAMASAILGVKLANTITLKISLVHTAEFVDGAVHTPVCTYSNTSALRAFPITLDRTNSEIEMFNTLAHEIRHVEQLRRGRYQLRRWASDKQLHARWEGVEMGTLSSLPYYTRPWEVEARKASHEFGHLR